MVSRELARDLLTLRPGDRIPTVTEYQERLGAGSGTVQHALRELRNSGAIKLRARGHQGSFIEEENLAQLWIAAGLGPIRVIVTAPGAVDGFGLVRGIGSELRRLGIPVEFTYAVGSGARVDAVLEGQADVAVLSAGAADGFASGDDLPLRTVKLAPHSYYQPGSLRVLSTQERKPEDPIRVGIDTSSADHVALTYAQFPRSERFSFVPCRFQSIPAGILASTIDVGVWHEMALLIPLDLVGIDSQPMNGADSELTRASLSAAVLAYHAEDAVVGEILSHVDPAAVESEQQYVASLDPQSDQFQRIVWSR